MKFDIADVDAMGPILFADVVLHEMAHSLGFGSIWDRLGLVNNGLFTGEYAVAEFLDMGGSGSGIPVEQDYGAGTAGSHWDEETFVNELMTGYINNGDNPFSKMSAASFTDLGNEYAVAARLLDLDERGLAGLAKNAVEASFLDPAGKARLVAEIDTYTASWLSS